MRGNENDKIDQVISDIRNKYCLHCGTQALYCGCIYEDMVQKLIELKSKNEN